MKQNNQSLMSSSTANQAPPSQHKKRNSLDNNQVSSGSKQAGYFNAPSGPMPHYSSNAQKQR
jgi:hypothetical protein